MAYTAKSYEHLKGGALKGLSDSQLDQHFGLYKGYVTKLNEIEERLATADNTKPNYSFNEFSELKRREAVAFNGSFLHELYFENLGADGDVSAGLKAALEAAGGQAKVLADLKATAMGGPGWALLTRNRRDGKLHTYFVAPGAGLLGACVHGGLRHRPRKVPRCLRREHQMERSQQAFRKIGRGQISSSPGSRPRAGPASVKPLLRSASRTGRPRQTHRCLSGPGPYPFGTRPDRGQSGWTQPGRGREAGQGPAWPCPNPVVPSTHEIPWRNTKEDSSREGPCN